jgi:hypothetical protein
MMSSYSFAICATYYTAVILFYMILVSMVGYIRALLAKWMGDDSAEQQGFLTLNPMVHADIFGFILLMVLGIGWGKRIPINPVNIQGRFRWLKLSVAMLSGVFSYILFAVLGLVTVAYITGPVDLFGHLAETASARVSVISILHLFITLSVFLAAMELVINVVLLCTFFVIEHNENAWQYASYGVLIIPVLIFLLYGNQIQMLLAQGITSLAKLLARFLFRS